MEITEHADGFEEFFRLEYPRLLRISTALTGDRSLAEDLTQEALLRTHVAWSNVAHLDKPGAWSRHVLVNLTRDAFRRARRRRKHVDDRAAVSQLPDLPAEEVWRAVRALPRLQRAVVALHYVDDLSIEAVADVMGVTAGSVKSSLSRMNETSEESVDLQLRASSAALRSSVGMEAQIDGAWQRHRAASFGAPHRDHTSRRARRWFMALGSVALATVVMVIVVAVRQSPKQTITSPTDPSGLPTDELADGLPPTLCDSLHEAVTELERSRMLATGVVDAINLFARLGENARLAGATAFGAAADGTAEALTALDQLSADSRTNDTTTNTAETSNRSAAQRSILLQQYYLAALSLACYDAGYPVGMLRRIADNPDSTEGSTP